MSSDPQLKQRYSTLKIDSPSLSKIHSSSPAFSADEPSPMPRHIVRPIQFLFTPTTYFLGWLVSVGILLITMMLMVLLKQTTITQWASTAFLNPSWILWVWILLFLSQWGIHAFLVWFKERPIFKNQVFTHATLKSQGVFVGLIDFCLTALFALLLYVGAQLW